MITGGMRVSEWPPRMLLYGLESVPYGEEKMDI